MLKKSFCVGVGFFVGLTTDVLSGRTEEATDRTVRRLHEPLLDLTEVIAVKSRSKAFGGIHLRCPMRRDGRRVATFLSTTPESTRINVALGIWDYQGAYKPERVISRHHMAFGSSTLESSMVAR